MLFAASFTLVLPFFPTGTFERIEEEGDIATAFTLARMLSNTPISRGGPTSLVIYDIHALQVFSLTHSKCNRITPYFIKFCFKISICRSASLNYMALFFLKVLNIV